MSRTEQTPPEHEVEGLVLTTPAGGVMDTVLVTLVWAKACTAESAHTTRSMRANETKRAEKPASAVRLLTVCTRLNPYSEDKPFARHTRT
jgi:hypothetical protein